MICAHCTKYSQWSLFTMPGVHSDTCSCCQMFTVALVTSPDVHSDILVTSSGSGAGLGGRPWHDWPWQQPTWHWWDAGWVGWPQWQWTRDRHHQCHVNTQTTAQVRHQGNNVFIQLKNKNPFPPLLCLTLPALPLNSYLCLLSFPAVGTVDAEIEVPSFANPEVTNVFLLKPRVGQNIAMHAWATARNFFHQSFTILVHSPSFFPNPPPYFLTALALVNSAMWACRIKLVTLVVATGYLSRILCWVPMECK